MTNIPKGRVVGYELYQSGSPIHRGITNAPKRRLREHSANVGDNVRMHVVTRPMTRRQGYQWEAGQSRTRGYYRPKNRGGRTWVRPHTRNGRRVRGHWRR